MLKDYFDADDIVECGNAPAASTEALFPNDEMEAKEFLNDSAVKKDVAKVEKQRVEEVRWFYQSGKKKRWKPFIGCDSISIETEWRCASRYDTDSTQKRVCVRGGMYEADVLERRCFPVYWSSFNNKGTEESVDIIRGTWFYEANFLPLGEDLANEIESEHVEHWKRCSLESKLDELKTASGNTILHSLKFRNCHVDWYSANDIYMHNDAVSYRALRNIVQKFGASKTSTGSNKLHRGYREEARSDEYMPPVEHLVFVVHGIGSKPDRHKIVRNTNEFRLVCERISAKHFAHYRKRVEFLPVEWRSELVLDNGVVETLTPGKSLGVRQFLNNSAMDIMYYSSPLYRAEIVDGLRKQIFRLHAIFMKRNPDFQGKISVLAHSLGSVIMHDIMADWSPESLYEEYLQKRREECSPIHESLTAWPNDIKMNDRLESNLIQIQKAKEKIAYLEAEVFSEMNPSKGLGFAVENFFCLGSPLAIFLALRGQRPSSGEGTQDDIIPRSVCKRMFNIFHPADPIAYRIEPLIMSHYITVAPLKVHHNNATQKMPYSEMPTKAFMTETGREMASMSTKQLCIDRALSSMDIFGSEGHIQAKEICDDEDADEDTQTRSSDEGSMSPSALARRESYLKAISGGAVKVGKAIWGRARGSSVSQKASEDACPDCTLANDDVADIHEALAFAKRKTSDCSSRSASSSHKGKHKDSQQVGKSEKRSKADPEIPPDMIHLEHRLDFQLQEGFTESKLGYASLTSHTSYWGSQDVSLFVLMQIHPPSTMTQSMQF